MVIMFAVTIGLVIMIIGFLGIQHQKLFDDLAQNTDNGIKRTQMIIVNNSREVSNSTKAVLKNTTIQLDEHNDAALSKIMRSQGILVRIHCQLSHCVTPSNNTVFLTDALFTDGGWGTAGLNATRALNITTAIDNVAIADIKSTLIDYARNNKMIIAQGNEWGPPVLEVAKMFPDKQFIVFTGLVTAPNVESIYPRQNDSGYVLGALAAMMSKTGSIGCVGGSSSYPNIVSIFDGYRLGAQSVNPKINVTCTYLEDFQNPTKGKQAALALININKADVLFHVADLSGHGVIDAAKEKGVWAIGAVADQSNLAPNTVIASFVIDFEKAYSQPFVGGIQTPGLEEHKGASGDGVLYITMSDKVPVDVRTKIMDMIKH